MSKQQLQPLPNGYRFVEPGEFLYKANNIRYMEDDGGWRVVESDNFDGHIVSEDEIGEWICRADVPLHLYNKKPNLPDWPAIRIQLAGMAMQGILSATDRYCNNYELTAKKCTEIADALIAELQKQKE